jgi:hypothetical protein
VQPLWKTVWRLFKKLKIELPYDPVIPLLRIYQKEFKSSYNNCPSVFIAALVTIAKLWKQPTCPAVTNRLRKCGIYTQWNFTQSQRRMKFCHLQVNGWNWKTSS